MLKYTGHSTYCNKRPIQVERQLNKMKNGRSCEPDGIPTEALKQLGDWGVRQLTNIFNAFMQSGQMPDEWRESIITPIYKDKGDHMNCSNYRGIKLLSHTMKLWERIIDQRLRDIVSISDGQFGFKPGVGTTDAIFVIRTLCEKYRVRYYGDACGNGTSQRGT